MLPGQGAGVLDLQGSRRRLALGADGEIPQSQLALGDFQSTKYLITVEEYAAFLLGSSVCTRNEFEVFSSPLFKPKRRSGWR